MDMTIMRRRRGIVLAVLLGIMSGGNVRRAHAQPGDVASLVPAENGWTPVQSQVNPRVNARSSAEELLNAAWSTVTLAQATEGTDPSHAQQVWTRAIRDVETMLATHPRWVHLARQQEPSAAHDPQLIQEDTKDDRRLILEKYWALYHIGTAQFIRVMGYAHTGEDSKALEAAAEILAYYQHAHAWDSRGWFWSVARSLEVEYPSLYQEALQKSKELRPPPAVARQPVVHTLTAKPSSSPTGLQQAAVLKNRPPLRHVQPVATQPPVVTRPSTSAPPSPRPPPIVAELPQPAPREGKAVTAPPLAQPRTHTGTWWLVLLSLVGVATLGSVGVWIAREQAGTTLARPRPTALPPPPVLVPQPAPQSRTPPAELPPTFDVTRIIREAQYFAKPERALAFWTHRHGGATAKLMIFQLADANQLTAVERAGYQWIAAQLRKIHRQYPTLYFETLARSLQALPRCQDILGDDYPQWLRALLEVALSEGSPADHELITMVSSIAQDAALDHTIRLLALETLLRLGKTVSPNDFESVRLIESFRAEQAPETAWGITNVIHALGHANQDVGIEAFQRLATLNRPLVRQTLLDTLPKASGQMTRRIQELLIHYGPSAIPELVEALGHSSEVVRQFAQELLGQLKDRAFADLAIAIRQPERGRTVRLSVTRLLYQLYPNSGCQWEIREALLAVSQDPDPVLQQLSCHFLQQIGQSPSS